jgi:hypothetical protein
MLQIRVVEKMQHILCLVTSENRAVYEIMWKNVVELDRAQMTVYHGARAFHAG